MTNTDLIQKFKPIIDEIIPKSDKVFRNAFYKIYTETPEEADTPVSRFKALKKLSKTTIDKKKNAIKNTPAPLDFLKLKKEYEAWYLEIHFVLFENIFKEVVEDTSFKTAEKIDSINEIINSMKDIQTFMPNNSDAFEGLINYFERKSDFLKTQKKQTELDVTYYWPYQIEKLYQLHEALVRENFITENPFFLNSFETNSVQKKNKIIWKSNQRNLFALFYLIYKKKHTYFKEEIRFIIEKLFILNPSRSKENTRTNYKKFKDKLAIDPYWIEEKYSKINDIVNDLDLY
jgi:hypothetical protein